MIENLLKRLSEDAKRVANSDVPRSGKTFPMPPVNPPKPDWQERAEAAGGHYAAEPAQLDCIEEKLNGLIGILVEQNRLICKLLKIVAKKENE